MIFKIYNCDAGFTYQDVNYDLGHFDSITYEDPQNTRLTRGANQTDTEGLVYTEGGKEPYKATIVVLGLNVDLYNLLTSIFKKKDRVIFWAISRDDGSSKKMKQAILVQRPQQLLIDESAESMNVSLAFESFDMDEDHKS